MPIFIGRGAPFSEFARFHSLPPASAASSRRQPHVELAAGCLGIAQQGGSGLPCDHGRASSRARAANRYAAMRGARHIDSKCLFHSRGTEALCTVPLQCHSKQCANKHLRPPTARSDTVAFILPSLALRSADQDGTATYFPLSSQVIKRMAIIVPDLVKTRVDTPISARS